MERNALLKLRPEGLYCEAGDFYVDPWRPVARAVITHGHADHARVGHGQYFCTQAGLSILRHRLGPREFHCFEYGQSFALDNARVSLHSAGHILGSAQVRIEVDGEVWVVSGDYKRATDPSCAPFEVVPCDTFITEATFGLPIYRWAPASTIALEIAQWWQECRAKGQSAVLLCYALGKAQRVLAELLAFKHLLADCDEVLLHGAMQPLVDIYRDAGVCMWPSLPLSESVKTRELAGQLVLAPPAAVGSPWMRRFKQASIGFASGWMRVRGQRKRAAYDRGFVLSDHADWPALIQTIEQTRCKTVLATHGNTDALVQVMNERGIVASSVKTELGGEN
jgi:putative mRNA 3-end processing factor